jgi:hypothetical protein
MMSDPITTLIERLRENCWHHPDAPCVNCEAALKLVSQQAQIATVTQETGRSWTVLIRQWREDAHTLNRQADDRIVKKTNRMMMLQTAATLRQVADDAAGLRSSPTPEKRT